MAYDSDPANRLAAVRAEINEILGSAQEYSQDGRRAQRALLRDLWQMEKEIAAEVAQAGGTGVSVVRVGRPT